MTRAKTVRHVFVDEIPTRLDEATLYISIQYATVVHRCLCGCGDEIVTPLNPTEWRLTYDGESVSLAPSIGNWSSVCQSHYWVARNHVRWSARWSRERIDAARRTDGWENAEHYGTAAVDDPDAQDREAAHRPARRAWPRFRKFLRR